MTCSRCQRKVTPKSNNTELNQAYQNIALDIGPKSTGIIPVPIKTPPSNNLQTLTTLTLPSQSHKLVRDMKYSTFWSIGRSRRVLCMHLRLVSLLGPFRTTGEDRRLLCEREGLGLTRSTTWISPWLISAISWITLYGMEKSFTGRRIRVSRTYKWLLLI